MAPCWQPGARARDAGLGRAAARLRRGGPGAAGGGCIHQAWRLELADGRSLFAKTNAAAALPMFEAELSGLRQLAQHAPAALVIPEPLAWGVAGDRAVLLLSWLQLAGSPGAAAESGWFQCGQGLAQLHRSSASSAPAQGYGAAADNFIGSAPQLNGWRSDWGCFCGVSLGAPAGLGR